HVRFCQDDGPCLAQLLHHESIFGGSESFHGERASSGLEIARIVIVLYDHSDTVQGTQPSRPLEFLVELVRISQGLWIDNHNRVQPGRLVISADTLKIGLYQLTAGDHAGTNR